MMFVAVDDAQPYEVLGTSIMLKKLFFATATLYTEHFFSWAGRRLRLQAIGNRSYYIARNNFEPSCPWFLITHDLYFYLLNVIPQANGYQCFEHYSMGVCVFIGFLQLYLFIFFNIIGMRLHGFWIRQKMCVVVDYLRRLWQIRTQTQHIQHTFNNRTRH